MIVPFGALFFVYPALHLGPVDLHPFAATEPQSCEGVSALDERDDDPFTSNGDDDGLLQQPFEN